MVDDVSAIHGEHPFATPPDERDPVRQFRGRLAAPVTVITSGGPEARAGLTVSSLVVAEGEPGRVLFLLGRTTDLYDAIADTRRFVVHVLGAEHREWGDRFAGLRPSPGGLFVGIDVRDGEHGPEIDALPNRLLCDFGGSTELEYHVVAAGSIERVDIGELSDPLVYFRGSYRALGR